MKPELLECIPKVDLRNEYKLWERIKVKYRTTRGLLFINYIATIYTIYTCYIVIPDISLINNSEIWHAYPTLYTVEP